MSDSHQSIEIFRFENDQRYNIVDQVAVEEPLEIRIVHGLEAVRRTKSLSVTMRTPGHDFELAAGFLVSEGLVRCASDIETVRFQTPLLDDSRSNIVEVELSPTTQFEPSKLQRHFYTTSSCGVCGKSSLDAIRADQAEPFVIDGRQPRIAASLIGQLPDSLRKQQTIFQRTGGLHGAGLVSLSGEWITLREDVGRHNAVDKVIGQQLLNGSFPLHQYALVLSGRASFELMQKSLLARVAIVIAVGAPSSLAVELANEFSMTLIGFTSSTRFNVYAGIERIT